VSYEAELLKKQYIPNTVIEFMGQYWAIREPDSGLTVQNKGLLDQVVINPTKVDPFAANTTINTYSFKLIDKALKVTSLFNGNLKFFQSQRVRIWIGRSFVGMPFSDYLPLPDTFVSAVTRDGAAYNFSSKEAKDRLNRAAFNLSNKLEVDILAATTQIDAVNDLSTFPTSGLVKIEDEFLSYTGIDTTFNRLTGCVRGEKNSIPVDHQAGATIYLVTEVVGNPVDILLKVLTSSGGGSVYDVLPDGAAIDQSLINITQFEALRNEFFAGQSYNLLFYGVPSIQKLLEQEILFANDLRIITDKSSKISLAILNRNLFNDQMPIIDETSIKLASTRYTVDDSEIINSVSIEYDYSEGTKKFLKLYTAEDADSIAEFGRRDPLELSLKGVKASMNGEMIVGDIAQRFLARFSYPRPQINFTSQMDKSLVNLADKVQLSSSEIPSDIGGLTFAETVEVLERGINYKTGDVTFKVGFTSFTGIRECYLAPSDTVLHFDTPRIVNVGAGRGSLYQVGWKMRLYSNVTRDHHSEQVNEIVGINGDVITFDNDWTGFYLAKEDGFALLQEDGSFILTKGLEDNEMRIMFADYDQVTEMQKRYCFISAGSAPFADGKKPYQITL